ncbi:MAG: hypothetical protein A3K67_04700 [Euryarchaeota archaeon RBG_16_62_10]|nr:MAG: hypothetical protein A3K67_04700 [Euryarchaeota archaeon RBG_16_62_10]
MSLVAWGTDLIIDIISEVGYPGVFLLMTVEGIFTPIPSELIIPFAGYLAAQGDMSLPLVVIVGSLGAAVGNTVAYFIGYRVGRPLIERYGRFLMLDEGDLRLAERWFARYGDIGVLLGHAVPGVRSFISFPAGIGRMKLANFVVFSTIGALIWTSVLAVAGYLLLEEWRAFADTTENIDLYVVIVALAIVVGCVYWRKVKAGRAGK